MSRHKETRATFRKLHRKEPRARVVGLSWHARAALRSLVALANDEGWICERATKGHPASILAQCAEISGNCRKGFYREVDELLAYGNDGEPGCLVIEDNTFRITGMDYFLGRTWRKTGHARDNVGTCSGHARDNVETTTTPKLPELHNTETATEREYRSKKVEGNIYTETDPEPIQASPPQTAKKVASSEPGSTAIRVYLKHYRDRYQSDPPKLDSQALRQIEQHASGYSGPVEEVLEHVLSVFFADSKKEAYGQHAPGNLKSEKAFAFYARGWEEEFEGVRRRRAEREHTIEVFRRLDEDERGAAKPADLEALMTRFHAAAAKQRGQA